MATSISLTAAPRDKKLKVAALRRTGQVPGVMYGHRFEATSLQFSYPAIERVILHAGTSHLISVSIEGDAEPHDVFIREVQRDPITEQILHVDMLAVVATEVVRNLVPIVQHGQSPVEDEGGVIVQMMENLEIECLPRNMPASIIADISVLKEFGDLIRVSDLPIPEGVTVLEDLDNEVITVTVPHAVIAEEAAEAEAAGEEKGESEG